MERFICYSVLVVLAGLIGSGAYAQEKMIRGTVRDDKGMPVYGATVTLKNSMISTLTDSTGNFSIRVPGNARTLVFTYVGMQQEETPIGSRTNLDVTMRSGAAVLNDVVVIGYGTQKREDVNGAISSVSARDLAEIPQPSVDQMLQGKVAGVTITQNSGTPGSATSVHIRGITAFTNSEPLYVIDGVEIQGDAGNASTSGQPVLLQRTGGGQEEQGVSPLAMLNPNDIESIDILKDASASAIYGSRGANGVVIITTKHGRNGASHLSYDGYYGIQQQGKFLKMMDLQQYATLENVLAGKFGIAPRGEFTDPAVLGQGTDWQKAIFRTAPEQSHVLSFSGGKDGMDYYLSGGYFTQEGTILGSDFNRYSFRATLNAQAKDWLKVGGTLYGSHSNQDVGLGDNTGIVYNALLSAPDAAIYNADGTFAGPTVSANGTVQGGVNPVAQALSLTNTLGRFNWGGMMYGDIRFLKDFSLHSELNGDFNTSNAATFTPTYTWGTFTNQTARLTEYNTLTTYWDWKENLNYTHNFNGKNDLTALLGFETWESTWNGVNNSVSGFQAGNTIQTLSLASTISPPTENKGSQVMGSLMARAIYTFENKYSMTATIRDDRSSKFAPQDQVGYFPSVAVSWRISEEPFMDEVKKTFNNMKIRLGYGTTGNQNIGNYLYGSQLRAVYTGIGTGFLINNVANPNLKWETSIQSNAGVDFGMLNNRLTFSFDAYYKTSSNFLFSQPLPAVLVGGTSEYFGSAAINPPEVNAGKIRNNGYELSITSNNINKNGFVWTTTVIFSHYANRVISLNGYPAILGSVNTSFVSLPATKTSVGGPVGEFFGYKTAGVIKTAAQLKYLAAHPQNVTGGSDPVITNDPSVTNSLWLGDLQYQDISGPKGVPDGRVDQYDQIPLGDPNPDFTYSISNTLSYKGFDLSLFLNGSHGGKILNALDYQVAGLSGLYQNQLASSINFWSPSNPNSNIPAPRAGITNNNLVMSDRFLEPASFLRVQNVRLGYNLPDRVGRHLSLSHLLVYISAQNLYVFTRYTGLDPEIGSLNQNPTLMNIDMGRYPVPRTITFGINAQF